MTLSTGETEQNSIDKFDFARQILSFIRMNDQSLLALFLFGLLSKKY